LRSDRVTRKVQEIVLDLIDWSTQWGRPTPHHRRKDFVIQLSLFEFS
jgi:hypothetical protein